MVSISLPNQLRFVIILLKSNLTGTEIEVLINGNAPLVFNQGMNSVEVIRTRNIK